MKDGLGLGSDGAERDGDGGQKQTRVDGPIPRARLAEGRRGLIEMFEQGGHACSILENNASCPLSKFPRVGNFW